MWITVMFLSDVWTHSDGTHSLQRIYLQICYDEEINSPTSWTAWRWEFSANLHFWVNYYFNTILP